jgi:membrane fusion protein (multidrug efflux system)
MKQGIYAVLICGYLVCLSGCKEEKKEVTSASAPSGPRTFNVDGFVVKHRSLEQKINTTGNLIANETVQVRPERAGKLVSLNFQESSSVKSGQLLAKIDDADLLAQRSRLFVNLDLAKKEVARGKELLKIQGISAEEMDRLDNRVDDINAEIKIIDIQIEKSRILAPFSGVLGLRQVSQGAYITPNDIIIDLQQVNPIKLEFDVPERYISQVKETQTLEFTVVGSDRTFQAKVYAIGTEISPTTRTFKVRATAQNNQDALKPGQFAKVNLVTGRNDKAILVPTDAIIPVLNGKQVYIAKNGRAIASLVETGERLATEVEVLEGVQVGDTIITSGIMSLSDGAIIKLNKVVESKNTQL